MPRQPPTLKIFSCMTGMFTPDKALDLRGGTVANKQVIAYFMNDAERAAALQALIEPTATESFVLGAIDEDAIRSLREKGLIVQEQQEAAAVSDQLQAQTVANMHAFGFVTHPMVVDALAVPEAVDYYRIFLKGPLLEDWRNQLQDA